MSFAESVANVLVGFVLAVATQFVIFPMFGMTVSIGDNLIIGSIFTLVSLARSYLLRRLFESSANAVDKFSADSNAAH